MFTMDSTFIVNIGFTLLVAGIITYYIRQQIESSNHKISSMFSLVSSLTQELNEIKKNMIGGNNVFNNNSSPPETVDGRIAVPSELKKIVISENNDSSDNEEDDSSDNEDDDDTAPLPSSALECLSRPPYLLLSFPCVCFASGGGDENPGTPPEKQPTS